MRTVTVFNVKVYVVGLYLAQPSHDGNQILASPATKVIRLQYVHAGSKATWRRPTATANGATARMAGATRGRGRFRAAGRLSPAVKVGDTHDLHHHGNRMRVLENDQVLGEFADKDLAREMLMGFIGPKPPSQELKNRLLGLPE